MQNKRIANERITASSSKSTDNSPHFARLDGSKAWCSALCDKLPYIQIQLEEPKIITEIITQGSSSDRAWATKYEVRFLEMESGKNIMRFLEFYMISFLYLIFVLWFTGLYQGG